MRFGMVFGRLYTLDVALIPAYLKYTNVNRSPPSHPMSAEKHMISSALTTISGARILKPRYTRDKFLFYQVPQSTPRHTG